MLLFSNLTLCLILSIFGLSLTTAQSLSKPLLFTPFSSPSPPSPPSPSSSSSSASLPARILTSQDTKSSPNSRRPVDSAAESLPNIELLGRSRSNSLPPPFSGNQFRQPGSSQSGAAGPGRFQEFEGRETFQAVGPGGVGEGFDELGRSGGGERVREVEGRRGEGGRDGGFSREGARGGRFEDEEETGEGVEERRGERFGRPIDQDRIQDRLINIDNRSDQRRRGKFASFDDNNDDGRHGGITPGPTPLAIDRPIERERVAGGGPIGRENDRRLGDERGRGPVSDQDDVVQLVNHEGQLPQPSQRGRDVIQVNGRPANGQPIPATLSTLPCLVVGEKGVEVSRKSCSQHSPCSLGPLRARLNAHNSSLHYCRADEQLLVSLACRFSDGHSHPAGEVRAKQQCVDRAACRIGPLTLHLPTTTASGQQTVEAFFCETDHLRAPLTSLDRLSTNP